MRRLNSAMPEGNLPGFTVQSPKDERSSTRLPNQPSSMTKSSTPSGLPAVEKDRALPPFPQAADDMLVHELLEVGACSAQTLVAVGQHRFRAGERLARHELPAQRGGVDAGQQPELAVWGDIDLLLVVAAVDQVAAIDLAVLFRRCRTGEEEQGVVAGRRDAAAAFDDMGALAHMAALQMPLPCPGAVEREQVPVVVDQVELQRIQLAYVQVRVHLVRQAGRADDDIAVVERRVAQRQGQG